LHWLQELDLSNNQISDISFLKDLKQLNSLYLSDNQISDISSLLFLLKKEKPLSIGFSWSKNINLDNNPLETPPPEIVEKGRESVLAYFNALEKSEKYLETKEAVVNEVKLVFIGNSTAGKTTLAQFLKTDKISKNHATTHGIQHWVWKPKSGYIAGIENLQIQIFDFGGQEYYHDTHHLFFTTDTAYILLWEEKTNLFGSQNTKIKITNGKKTKEVEVPRDFFPIAYWLDTIDYFTRKKATKQEEKEAFVNDASFKKVGRIDIRKESQKFRPSQNEISYQQQSYKQTPVLIIQNKVKLQNKETNNIFINNKQLQDKYPFIYDISAVSLHEKYRTQNVKALVQENIFQFIYQQFCFQIGITGF